MLRKCALPATAMLGFLLSIASVTYADPAADAKAAIQSAIAFGDDSFTHKNLAGSLAIMTDDCVEIDGTKTHSLQDLKMGLSGLFAVAQDLSSVTTITDFLLHGKDAEVSTHGITTYVMVNPQTLQNIKYSDDDTERALWVQQGGVWREKRSRSLTHQQTQSVVTPVASTASGSIVGKWFATIPGPGGKPVQWTIAYLADGSEFQQMLFADGKTVNIEATYTAQNNVLTQILTKGNVNGEAAGTPGKPTSLNYKLEGDTLTLSLPTYPVPLVFARIKAAQ